MPPAATAITGLPQRFYTLENGQFHRIDVLRTSLSNIDAHLRDLATEVPVILPHTALVESLPVISVATPKRLVLAVKCPTIRLTTHWALRPNLRRASGPGRLVPNFVRDSSDPMMSPEWRPPTDMRAWFMVTFLAESGSGNLPFFRVNASYLAATCTAADNQSLYKFPLPNNYTNGKMCLGPNIASLQPSVTTPVLETFQGAYHMFVNNAWNQDLLDGTPPALIESCFSFNAETNEQIATPADWPNQWTRMSNTDINQVPFKQLS